jgi:DNA-directed RNA polymerase specialized sigma24 family protein
MACQDDYGRAHQVTKEGNMIDQPSWDAIVSDLKSMFIAFIYTRGLNTDVDDVLQDTWVIAHEHYEPEKGSLYAFCTKVGHNLIKSEYRAQAGSRQMGWAISEMGRLQEQADELTQVIERQVRFEEWSPQWDMVAALMNHKHSMEARVLWAMYEFIVKHDEVPTLQQTAAIVGVSHTTVWTTLKDIVKDMELVPVERSADLYYKEER